MTTGEVQISGLFVYPVKSCRGISLDEAPIEPMGFLHDREFLVVDENDAFLTQRNAPALATIEIGLEETGMVLDAPDVQRLRVSFTKDDEPSRHDAARPITIFDDHVLADDVGKEAAGWFGAVLHRPCRLVQMGASYSRKARVEKIAPGHRWSRTPDISFTDAFPTLLVSEESLADLNTRLPEPIPMTRFRPNIVVRGCAPYDENTWNTVEVGGIVFGCATTCLRCVITSIDQQTGIRQGPEPLRTLATYRRSPDGKGVIFGQYLIHSGTGTLRIGDALVPER